ncbi:MAG: transposase [Rickettsiaceae bacterium]|nr:transposase [Rickettsiaceae bacterium]
MDSKRKYKKNGHAIKFDNKINVELIKSNWDDILRLIATIKTKTSTASQIFKRLNSYTKEPKLYKALKEFGRIIKTIYIFTYLDDVVLRQQIEKQLNKIESSNKFAKAVFFANSQEFRAGSTEEQMLIVACRSFIQNCIVLWNYLYSATRSCLRELFSLFRVEDYPCYWVNLRA